MHGTPSRGIKRIVAVVAVTVTALFALNLGSLVVATRRAEAVESIQATRVASERLGLDRLETETDRARSDRYVEEYIRNERNWSRPGDRVVLPVPEAGDAAGPAPVTAESPPPGFWDRLRRWLNTSPTAQPTPSPVIPTDPPPTATP